MLARWQNVTPFRTVDELRDEMARSVHEMGPDDASTLAEALISLEREGGHLLDPLLDLVDLYAEHNAASLAEALTTRLAPDGPPNAVEVLGATRSPLAVDTFRKRLDLENADEDLLVAVACALGDIGNQDASDMLLEMSRRSGLSAKVRQELEIALKNMGAR
jgi:hypothetical protein